MPGRDDELVRMKTDLDLRAFAAHAFGYQLEAERSSANSAVMRSPDGRRVIIARAIDGHHVWFEIGDQGRGGSIIDLAQAHGVGSIGACRVAIRPHLDATPAELPDVGAPLTPITRDIAAVRARFEAAHPLEGGQHLYLNEIRRLPPALLAGARFRDRIRLDERGNALFPSFDRDGLCGVAISNQDFKGQGRGSAKGLWATRTRQDDRRLLVCESAIDCLSYYALHPCAHMRAVSIAGEMSPAQRELLELAIRKMPPVGANGGEITLALDNDAAGRRLTAKLVDLVESAGRRDLTLRDHHPDTRGADWNDVLVAQSSPPPPPPTDTPSHG